MIKGFRPGETKVGAMPEANRLIRILRQVQCIPSDRRHPDDVIAQPNESHYNSVGSSFRNILAACLTARLNTTPASAVNRVLDFGCGYGRITRVLRAIFPEAEIVASDLTEPAVDFCCEAFNCTPHYSKAAVDHLEIEGKFDVIFLGSVITHLSEDRTRKLLSFLIEKLHEGGLLVASSVGCTAFRLMLQRLNDKQSGTDYSLPSDRVMRWLEAAFTTGYGYQDYPGYEAYGISCIEPQWFHRFIAGIEETRVTHFGEAVWDFHHDIIAFQRGSVTPERFIID
jgi:SAM-dependent methyltransferase